MRSTRQSAIAMSTGGLVWSHALFLHGMPSRSLVASPHGQGRRRISSFGASAAYAICIRAVSRAPGWFASAGGTHFCGGYSPGRLSTRLLHGGKGGSGATAISLASSLSTISHHIHPHPVRTFCLPRENRVYRPRRCEQRFDLGVAPEVQHSLYSSSIARLYRPPAEV